MLSDWKLSFCFSFVALYLWNSVLEFLEEEFVEKVSASVSVISFILVIWMLFLMRILRVVGWFLPGIFRTIFQTVFFLVEEFSWFTKFCKLVLLACLIVFLALALNCLNELRLRMRGSFWNLRSAAFRSWIAVLQSLLNQGVLCLFDGEFFGIVSFAIAIKVSVKCFIRTIQFGSWTSFVLHKFLNFCQLAMFVFHQWGGSVIFFDWLCYFQNYGKVVTATGIVIDFPYIIQVTWWIRESDIDCRVGTGRWVEISWSFVIQYAEVTVIDKLFQICAHFVCFLALPYCIVTVKVT